MAMTHPGLDIKKKKPDYTAALDSALRVFFKDALTVSLRNPGQAAYFFQTVVNQRKAAGIRAKWEKQGIQVPPIAIVSITNRCNLHCLGCYHQAIRDISKPEMSEKKLRTVISEAGEIGISFIVLAGGEPLVRRDILDITRDHPGIIFLMATNGLLITDEVIARFKEQKNIVPLISLEGFEQETDRRRGQGVYAHLKNTMKKLKKADIFFGTSLTLTRENYTPVTNDKFIRNLNELGCKFFLFLEYAPVKENTEDWVITEEQRTRLAGFMNSFRTKYSALFISVPGDEKDFGGCLSAGRGFIHISAEGDVEPCPFVPYSNTNLRDKSLIEALQSNFLKAIRESEGSQDETAGSCALLTKKEWLQALLKETAK